MSNKIISLISDQIDEAIENGYHLRGITPKGQFVNKGQIDDPKTCINEAKDLLDTTNCSGVAVMVELSPGLIVLDLDSKHEGKKNRLKNYIDKNLGKNQFVRIGSDEKLYQLWGYTESKTKFRKGLDLEIINKYNERKRVNALGLNKKTGKYLKWPMGKFWEVPFSDLPYLSDDFINDIIDICGVDKKKTLSFNEEGRHNTLIKICGGKISDGKDPTTIVNELLEYDKENHTPAYFTDKTEPHGGKGYWTAFNMYTSLLSRAVKNNDAPEPFNPSHTITIGDVDPIKEYKKNFKKLPRLPGFGAALFNDQYDNSPIPRTQLCYMNVLNLISIMVGTKYSHKGTFCNLYQYGVAPSGYGKDFSFKRSKQILLSSGCGHLMGSSAPTSDTVVLTLLEQHREKCMFINEAESLLKRISNDRTNNGLRECLTDIYDDAGKQLTPKFIKSVNPKNPEKLESIGNVFSPYVSILMTSTDTAFEQYASEGIFGTGLLNRFLFFFEDRYREERFIDDYNPPIPDDIIEGCRLLSESQARELDLNRDSMSHPFEINKAIISDNANSTYRELHEIIKKEKKETAGTKFHGLIARKKYFINKFAPLHHVMVNPSNYVKEPMKEESYWWAKEAVDAIMHNMIQHLDDNVSSSPYGRHVNSIAKFIKGRTVKKKETMKKEISARFSNIDKSLRDKVIKDLQEMGRIVMVESKGFLYVE